ncbi:Xanthine dehydrogenase, partial [Caligus rogercresseyi]
GGALVHVYKDGSVLATHGGVEMGQGLHVKMAQIVSKVLGIPMSFISICSSTSTDKVPNTSATAASVGSDLYGMAIKEACEIIYKRLEPILEPDMKWTEIVSKAYESSISLSSTGHYSVKGLGMDWTQGKVGPIIILLMAWVHPLGALCLRSEVVMDLGESLNPAIDVGKSRAPSCRATGSLSWNSYFTLLKASSLRKVCSDEVLQWICRNKKLISLQVQVTTKSQFNVSLLRGSKNVRAVFSSKAV